MIFAGDTHGHAPSLRALGNAHPIIIQVGDFGWGDGPADQGDPDRFGTATWITCGGNHDNWPLWRSLPLVERFGGLVRELSPNVYFADRNMVLTVEGKRILFLGGANSHDRALRIVMGKTWHPEEAPSREELYSFMDTLEREKPDIVVTHDAPNFILEGVGLKFQARHPLTVDLEQIVKGATFLPKDWFFGHHHKVASYKWKDTTYHCCGMHEEFVCYSTR